jgi:hypothetical protein
VRNIQSNSALFVLGCAEPDRPGLGKQREPRPSRAQHTRQQEWSVPGRFKFTLCTARLHQSKTNHPPPCCFSAFPSRSSAVLQPLPGPALLLDGHAGDGVGRLGVDGGGGRRGAGEARGVAPGPVSQPCTKRNTNQKQQHVFEDVASARFRVTLVYGVSRASLTANVVFFPPSKSHGGIFQVFPR